MSTSKVDSIGEGAILLEDQLADYELTILYIWHDVQALILGRAQTELQAFL